MNNEPVYANYLYLARYCYTGEVQENNNLLRIFPRSDAFQYAEDFQFLTIPSGREIAFTDAYGNRVRRSHVETPHHQLIIASAGRVRLYPLDFAPQDMPLGLALTSPMMLPEYLSPSPLIDPHRLRDAALDMTYGSETLFEVVSALVAWVSGNIEYVRGVTSVVTRADQVLESLKGVCQDMAHLTIALLRALHIPARYVSGIQIGEVGETHAWVEYYHPEAGWLACDPTHNNPLITGPGHIRFAVGRDYTDVPPVLGEFIARGDGYLDKVVAEAKLDGATAALEEAIQLVLNA